MDESRIQLLEVAINAPLAEWNSASGGKIGLDTRALRHAIAQRDQSGHFLLEPLHPPGERITQSLDNLEDREIDITQPAADHISAAVALEYALEVAEEFWHAITPEILGAPLRGRLLLLKVEPAGDRMVRIVDVLNHISDGELQLMRPQPARFVSRRNLEPWAEVEQDQRGLCDHELAGLEKRRCIRRIGAALVFEHFHHRRNATVTRSPRDIDVIGASLFECEPDEFAAALNGGPIIELVTHRPPSRYPAVLYCSSVTGSIHSTCVPSSASCIAT